MRSHRGFVLVATLIFASLVTLSSVAAFEMMRDASRLARNDAEVEAATARILRALPAIEAIDNRVSLSCDVQAQSRATLRHQPLAWWETNACLFGADPSVYFIREPKERSVTTVIATETGFKLANFQRITLATFTPSAIPVHFELIEATASNEGVTPSPARRVIPGGRQQLECLVG